MKKLIILSVLGAATILFAEQQLVEIPFANSDFENGFDGWNSKPYMHLDRAVKHGGAASACLEVTDYSKQKQSLQRLVPVRAGCQYVCTAFLKTEDVRRVDLSCGAGMFVEWYNADRKWIDGGDRAVDNLGTADWKELRCKGLNAPADAAYASIYLVLRGEGKAWFDDVRFYEIHDETAKLAPANGATLDCNTPEFSWRVRAGVQNYLVELSQDPAFPASATKICDAGGFYFHRLREPLEPGIWYWRVSTPGMKDATSFSFKQTAAKNRDCLPPLVKARGARVLTATESFSIAVFDEGVRRPTVSFAGGEGAFVKPTADGLLEYRIAPPAGGWKAGLTTDTLVATDAVGNRLEKRFYLLNMPAPAAPIRMDEDGYFSEGGKRIFPLGIYQVKPEYLQEVRAAGFEVVHLYEWEYGQDDVACRAYLDQCRANGLKAFIGFDRGHRTKNGILHGNYDHVAARVAAIGDHPSLLLWYLIDEPFHFARFLTADHLSTFTDLLHELDPYHPVVITTGGRNMKRYRKTWDSHWSQCYGDARQVVDHLADHRKSIEVPSPITLLLNCNCDKLGEKYRLGEPINEDEFTRDYDFLRACAVLGITENCNGVFWWWFARESKPKQGCYSVGKSPKAMANLSRVVRELTAYRKALFVKGEVTRGHATAAGGEIVSWWVKDFGEKAILFAVNTANHPVTVSVEVPEFGLQELEFGRYGVLKITK